MIIENIAVALAAEGVPVGCIARACRLNRDALKTLIDAALADGRIAERPAPDWLGTRYTARPTVGRAVMADHAGADAPSPARLQQSLGLSATEAIGLNGLMVATEPWSSIEIGNAMFNGRAEAARAMISRLRQTLKGFGLGIDYNRKGYFLTCDTRARLVDLVERDAR